MSKSKAKAFSYPYPRPAVTVDIALVTQETPPQVLLIQRKHDPFAGTWALPGGFVDEKERLIDAAKRELFEETNLTNLQLEQFHTFGDPGRDPRGWTISVVYLARLDNKPTQAQANDDAAEIGWFPITQLPSLAFDHADILALVKAQIT